MAARNLVMNMGSEPPPPPPPALIGLRYISWFVITLSKLYTVLQKYAHIGLNQNLFRSQTSLPDCLTMLPLFVFMGWEDFQKISRKCVG